MIEISSDAPKKSILDFVKRWMKLLADDRLDKACAFLLGSVTEKVVTIDPSRIQGLNIRLVESRLNTRRR